MLIDKGYLRSNIWSGKRPEYYLEIKSTTGPCENPFYMSMYQYQTVCFFFYNPFFATGANTVKLGAKTFL